MIVKVEIDGTRARVRNHDDSLRVTVSASAPLRARMRGRRVVYFLATVESGGGRKDWGKGEVAYLNPTDIVDLGDEVKDQDWEPSPRSKPPAELAAMGLPTERPAPVSSPSRSRCRCPGCQPTDARGRLPGVVYDADSGVVVGLASDEVRGKRVRGGDLDRRPGQVEAYEAWRRLDDVGAAAESIHTSATDLHKRIDKFEDDLLALDEESSSLGPTEIRERLAALVSAFSKISDASEAMVETAEASDLGALTSETYQVLADLAVAEARS